MATTTQAAVAKKFTLPHPFALYGTPTDSLSPAQIRIVGVLPLLTRLINGWIRRLKPREQAQFDVDDLLQEMWLVLLEKDHYYEPSRARYTTFAGLLCRQHLGEMHVRCHLIRTKSTDSGLERAAMPDDAFLPDPDTENGPPDQFDEREHLRSLLEQAVASSRLTNSQAFVLCGSYGLFGCPPRSSSELARELGIPVNRVASLRKKAEQAVKATLAYHYA